MIIRSRGLFRDCADLSNENAAKSGGPSCAFREVGRSANLCELDFNSSRRQQARSLRGERTIERDRRYTTGSVCHGRLRRWWTCLIVSSRRVVGPMSVMSACRISPHPDDNQTHPHRLYTPRLPRISQSCDNADLQPLFALFSWARSHPRNYKSVQGFRCRPMG